MGAKVQLKSYIPVHNGIRNKDELSSSSFSWYYKDNLSNHLYDGSLLREAKCYSQCDKEMLKRMILEHEATFTMQVSELHRLYKIQKELMNEFKHREQQKLCSKFQTNIFASHMFSKVSEEFQQLPHLSSLGGHPTTGNVMELSLIHFNESGTRSFQIPIKTECSSAVEGEFLNPKTRSPPRKKFDLHLPAEIYIDIDDEIITEKQNKPCVRVANLSRITHSADGDNNLKLSLRSIADDSINDSLMPALHPESVSSKMVLADLNEPLKLSSCEEGEVLAFLEDIGSTTEREDIIGHQLQSERTLSSWDFFLGNYGRKPTLFSNSVNTEQGIFSKGCSSSTNAYGELECIANGSHKGLCDGEFSITSQCAEEKPNKNDKFILPGQNKSDKWIGEISSPGTENSEGTSKLLNLNTSELATTHLPHPFPNIHRSDIFSISSLPISSRRTSKAVGTFNWPCNDCNQSDDVQDVACSKQIFKNGLTFCQNDFQQDDDQSLEPCFRKNKAQLDSSNIEESAFQIKSLMSDPKSLASTVNNKILGEMNNVGFRNEVNLYSSASSMITEKYLKGTWDTEAEKDNAFEEEIKELNCNLTNVKITLNEESDHGSHEAAENLVAMSFLISNHSHDHTGLSNPTSYDTLYWFADFVASTEQSTEISREKSPVDDNDDDDVGLDMFEFLTLKLKETKDEFVRKPQENQSHNDPCTASLLVTRSRRGLVRKRRQRSDFQKDILPGLRSLSRHEVAEDLQSFESIMKASSKSWKAVSSRSTRWKGENFRARRWWRTRSLPITVDEINISSSPKQEISTAGILSWGRTTRRCQRQKVLPGILSVPLV